MIHHLAKNPPLWLVIRLMKKMQINMSKNLRNALPQTHLHPISALLDDGLPRIKKAFAGKIILKKIKEKFNFVLVLHKRLCKRKEWQS